MKECKQRNPTKRKEFVKDGPGCGVRAFLAVAEQDLSSTSNHAALSGSNVDRVSTFDRLGRWLVVSISWRQDCKATRRQREQQQKAATLLLGHGRHSVEATADVSPCPAALGNFGQHSACDLRPWGKREGRAEKRRALSPPRAFMRRVLVRERRQGPAAATRKMERERDKTGAGRDAGTGKRARASVPAPSRFGQLSTCPASHRSRCFPLATGAGCSLEAAVYNVDEGPRHGGRDAPIPTSARALSLTTSACQRRSSATTRIDILALPTPTVESLRPPYLNLLSTRATASFHTCAASANTSTSLSAYRLAVFEGPQSLLCVDHEQRCNVVNLRDIHCVAYLTRSRHIQHTIRLAQR